MDVHLKVQWIGMFIAGLLILPETGFSLQNSESGPPLYNFYTTADFKAHNQSWRITQDSTQRIYVANNHGVLRFDGNYWTMAPSLNGGLIRSIATDSLGTIYWGGQSDFGYVTPDSSGSIQLVSLQHLLPDSLNDYHNVWNIIPTEKGVYFRTNDYFFRLIEDSVHVLSEGRNYRHVSLVGNRLVVQQFNNGLQFLDGDTFSDIPGSELFSKDLVGGILELDSGNWLILTYFKGLYTYDGFEFRQLDSSVNPNLSDGLGYKAIMLSNGNIALATLYSGLYVIDQQGKLVTHTHIEELPVTSLFQDQQKGLWATMNGGIARIEIESPLSVFYKESGIPATVNQITRHNGTIYAGGDDMTYRLQTYPDRTGEFIPVVGLRHQTWALLSTEHGLLAGTQQGLFVHQNGKTRPIREGLTVRSLKTSVIQPGTYLVGTLGGIRTLQFKENNWLLSEPVQGIDINVHYIAESPDSILWLGSHYQGIMRVEHFYDSSEPDVLLITNKDGFPARNDQYTNTFWLDDHLAVGTSLGLYQINEETMQAIPDSSFGPLFTGPGKDVFRVEQSPNGDWYIRSSDNGILRVHTDGSFQWDSLALRRLTTGSTRDFHFDPYGAVWMVTNRGIVRYESAKKAEFSFVPKLNFNKVYLTQSNSLIYGGSPSAEWETPLLSYTQNAIRFQYALSSYDIPESSEYRYRLLGSESAWSEWSGETQKDYTNLPPGNFLFQVQGRDLYANLSPVQEFGFSILPPWYLTGWAKFFYVLAVAGIFVGGAFLYTRHRTRRLQERNLLLEQEVQLRTAEIEKQKQIIEQNLAEKEVLLKEIHHRVKNNLQIIYSLLNLQKETITDEQILNAIKVGQTRIKSMSLVHEILYKNEDIKSIELAQYIRNLVEHIENNYSKNGVDTEIQLEPCEAGMNVAIPLGLTINEVVSNAFKHAFHESKKGLLKITGTVKEGVFRIIISDNGPGFDPEKNKDGEETLGLMLINDMIRQLKGTKEIEIKSGTRYVFNIPLNYG